MGRKRRSIKVTKANPASEFKDQDGLYFFKETFDVTDKKGKVTRVFLNGAPDDFDPDAFDGKCVGLKGNTFYTNYKDQFPQLVRELGVALQTKYIKAKSSGGTVGNSFPSVQIFMEFIAALDTPEKSMADLDFDCMLEIRKAYQESNFNPEPHYRKKRYDDVKSLIEQLMGTSIGPKPFVIPHFKTDGMPEVKSHSDWVTFQIAVAALTDCEKIMRQVKLFRTYDGKGSPTPLPRGLSYTKGDFYKDSWTPENFAWFFVNRMELERPPYPRAYYAAKSGIQAAQKNSHRLFGLSFTNTIASKSDMEWQELAKSGRDPRIQPKRYTATVEDYLATWREKMSFTVNGLDRDISDNAIAIWCNKTSRNSKFEDLFFPEADEKIRCRYAPFSTSLNSALLQLDVAVRDTLFPFYLVFHIFTGRNTEVIKSWKRYIRPKDTQHSLLESLDALEPDSVLIEGWKVRGKGNAKRERDTVQIRFDSRLYQYLEFVLDYTQPVATATGNDAVWCYAPTSATKSGDAEFNGPGTHAAVRSFCKRHAIYDDDGNRMKAVNLRKFRKVHLTKEILESVGKHDSMEAVIADLKENAHHKSFDTTFSRYLNNDTTTQFLDAGIVVLQEQFLDESRNFIGHLCEEDSGPREGEATPTNRCGDPVWSDSDGNKHRCTDYDFCLGCERARVYPENLPSICTRLLQYEEKQIDVSEADWQEKYADKHARALDVITRWQNKEQVETAWAKAKSGAVKMPPVW